MTDDELAACQAALATLRTWAEAAVRAPVTQREANATMSHARGYTKAARDVLAILGRHGRPPREPVTLKGEL